MVQVFQTKTTVGEDGKVLLEVPCRLPPGTVEVVVILSAITEPTRWRDIAGVGKEVWQGVDAQQYADRLRDGRDL